MWTHIYTYCPFVRPSVRPSIRLSVCPSVSVCPCLCMMFQCFNAIRTRQLIMSLPLLHSLMLSMLQRSIRTRQTDHFVVCVCMSVPLSAVLNAPTLHQNKTICSVRVLSWPAPRRPRQRRPRQWPCWSSGWSFGASPCPTMRLCDAPDVTLSRCACVM